MAIQTKQLSLLIVDDDSLIHQAVRIILPNNWKMFSAMKVEDIDWDRHYNAAMVDMHLSRDIRVPDGPKIIKDLAKKDHQLEIIAMSGDLSRELMETCLVAGATRFVGKPLSSEEIVLILEKIEALWELRSMDTSGRAVGPTGGRTVNWIGDGTKSQEIKKAIAQLRGEKGPVLIEGETGTGKEVIARMLHEQGGDRPFVVVNVASIPENLFESELFGHVKGAFTGADSNKMGLAEAAHGGDLFLDEIEALSLGLQVKLLRFLESGEVRRVGTKETQQVKVRVLVASNRPLLEMIKKGEFRDDLYFRLTSQRLELPPLRDRLEDIDSLAHFFLEGHRPRRNKQFSTDGIEALKQYNWPGNVRELKRVCEQLALTAPLPIIRAEDVQGILKIGQREKISISALTQNTPQTVANIPEDKGNLDPLTFWATDSYILTVGLNENVQKFEKQILNYCIKNLKSIDKTIEVLKISRSNFYKKLRDYNIELP